MGTYTANYQLYMPTIGEQGWGELINGNYQTIDTTMKSLSNRITAVENEVNGALSCTSVTTSGKVTANGGLSSTTGTFSGAVTATSFNGVVLKSSGTITVSSVSNGAKIYIPRTNGDTSNAGYILPYYPNVRYSGSIIIGNDATEGKLTYAIGDSSYHLVEVLYPNTFTLTFSNIPFLCLSQYKYTLFFREFEFS